MGNIARMLFEGFANNGFFDVVKIIVVKDDPFNFFFSFRE
jgi:hypothetical protein